VSNILLLAVLGWCWAAIKRGHLLRRRAALGLICVCAAVNAIIFVTAQIEFHAPKIMGLPFHHCLYCLWQYVPDTVVMYALFILGTFSTGWALLLDVIARTSETLEVLRAYLTGLIGFSMLCLAAALLMNAVHLATR